MLTLYIVCAVLGGGLMLVSALGGMFHGDLSLDHGPDFDAGHQIDFSHDIATTATDVDHHLELPHAIDVGWTNSDFWLAFVSMRFVTYFTGIFGITGTVLSLVTDMSGLTVALVSLLFGFVLGYGGSLLFRHLKSEGETSGVTAHDYIGALGRTLVGIKGSQPGKVRVSIKGDTIDMIALSEGEKEIGMGEEIVVVGLEGDRVRVAPKGDYLD
jgi:membrane protein implicated in regulation of membrane protease activity